MTWTFVMQLTILALVAAVLVMIVGEAMRAPGGHAMRQDGSGPPGPQGPSGLTGPKGDPGPPCQGACCRRVQVPPLRSSSQPLRVAPPVRPRPEE